MTTTKLWELGMRCERMLREPRALLLIGGALGLLGLWSAGRTRR